MRIVMITCWRKRRLDGGWEMDAGWLSRLLRSDSTDSQSQRSRTTPGRSTYRCSACRCVADCSSCMSRLACGTKLQVVTNEASHKRELLCGDDLLGC